MRQIAPVENSCKIAVPYEVDSLDPHAKNTISNFAIACHFYEPMVRTDASMKIQPCLARSWENPDPSTWIFHLEPSARFHNGKPLVAEDIVYSLMRLKENARLEMSTFAVNISGVSAIDPHTVGITTQTSGSMLLKKLNFVLIVPAGSSSENLEKHVNGTGPYRFIRWEKEERIEMMRNEQYWATKPDLERVQFLLGRSPERAMQELRQNACQLAQANSKKLENLMPELNHYDILVHDSIFVKYLGFDVAREITPYCSARPNPFRNKLVREAVRAGIDRAALIQQLPTFAAPVTQIVPSFIFGFNPTIPPPETNPDKAKALLRQAGFGGGFEVVLHARAILSETANLVREQLAHIGIRVEAKILSDPEFFQEMRQQRTSFYLTRQGSPTGDVSDILDRLFHSVDPARQYGSFNVGGYSEQEVDAAIEKSNSIADPDARRTELQRIMAHLEENIVVVPLYVDQEVYAIDKSLTWQPRNDSYVFAQEISLRKR